MKNIIDRNQTPRRTRAGAELLLADGIHPPSDDVGAVLNEVGHEKYHHWQAPCEHPATAVFRHDRPTRESHNAGCPDGAMNEAGKADPSKTSRNFPPPFLISPKRLVKNRRLFLVQCHPVVLEQVVANEVADEREEQGGSVHKIIYRRDPIRGGRAR